MAVIASRVVVYAGLFGLHVVDDKADFHGRCSTSSRSECWRHAAEPQRGVRVFRERGSTAGGPTTPRRRSSWIDGHVLEGDFADVQRLEVVALAEVVEQVAQAAKVDGVFGEPAAADRRAAWS